MYIETDFIRDGQALTAEALKEYFKTGGYVVYTVGDLFKDYMGILAKRVGQDLTPKTYRKYEIARDKFFKILPPTEPVTAITKAVIMDYQASMNLYLDYVTTNGYWKSRARDPLRRRRLTPFAENDLTLWADNKMTPARAIPAGYFLVVLGSLRSGGSPYNVIRLM